MAVLTLLLALVVWGLVFWIIFWGVNQIVVPEPFNKVIRVVLVLAAVVVVIGLLTGGIQPFPFLRLG